NRPGRDRLAELLLADSPAIAIRPPDPNRGASMKRTAALFLLLLAGCSTTPVADFLDFVHPRRVLPAGPAPLALPPRRPPPPPPRRRPPGRAPAPPPGAPPAPPPPPRPPGGRAPPPGGEEGGGGPPPPARPVPPAISPRGRSSAAPKTPSRRRTPATAA